MAQEIKPMTDDEVIQRLTKMGIKIELFYEWLDSDLYLAKRAKGEPYYLILDWFFFGLTDSLNYNMSI